MEDLLLMHEYLRRSAARSPGKTALVCGADRLAYRELEALSDRLAGTLRTLGLARGGRVVIFMDNCAEAVAALYAVLKAGGVFVIANGLMKGSKLGYILRDSGAEILVTDHRKERVASEALGALDRKIAVVSAGESSRLRENAGAFVSWDDAVAAAGGDADCGEIRGGDLAALIYTSGSTGDPKGVMSSHRSMASAARSIIAYLENREDDVILNALPLSFDYGLYQVLMAVFFGGTVVLERSFTYPVKVLERIGEEGVTGFPLVPSIAALLLRLQDPGRFDFTSLRYVTNTGAALPAAQIAPPTMPPPLVPNT